MAFRPALGAALVAIAATQPACVEQIRERCPLVTDPRPAPALPRDFVQLDDLLRHRALQMVHDARQLHGSATTSFHIVFGTETLPLWCDQMVLARDLAMRGRLREAGRKYQALLVLSQLMELSLAVHATVEYADSAGELSLTLSRTTETFGNQMEPLLAAALSEEPQRIEHALRQGAPALVAWRDYLTRWTAHIRADAERMKVAKAAWDITIGVIAAYETAGALAELAAGGGPPIMPLPALAGVGGGAAAMELSGAVYIELAESIRRLIASGALDAGIVAALSASMGNRSGGRPAPSMPGLSPMSAEGPGSGLSKQSIEELQKSQRSLQRLIQEHRQKLTDYQREPLAYDNQGTLRNAPESLRPKIIQGRVLALEKQIAKLEGELQKVNDLLDNASDHR